MEFKFFLNYIILIFLYRIMGLERKFLGKWIGIEICIGWKKICMDGFEIGVMVILIIYDNSILWRLSWFEVKFGCVEV